VERPTFDPIGSKRGFVSPRIDKIRPDKMAQQPAGDMYYPYSSTINRSPGSARPSYATGSNGAGLASRNQQRQLDPVGTNTGSFDRFNGFDSTPRYDRMSPAAAMHSTFANANAQAWSYNGSAATVNGNLHDAGGRLRSANRRPNLHPVRFHLCISYWML
jgi:hypothetical protein